MIDESVEDDELEGSVQKKVWRKLSTLGSRLFRVNTGTAWLSNLGPRGVKQTPAGLIMKQPRSVPLGFGDISNKSVTGTLDLQGYTMVVVTPEMVGQTVAVYTCVDAKRAKGGKKPPSRPKRSPACSAMAGSLASPIVRRKQRKYCAIGLLASSNALFCVDFWSV